MKDHKDLSLKVANAVLKQIEGDRAINRNSIQEAVQKELAVHEPEQVGMPMTGPAFKLARELIQLLMHELGVPYPILAKASDLGDALDRQRI